MLEIAQVLAAMRRVFGQEIWFGCTALCRTPKLEGEASESLAEMGGFKEAILEIQGDQVYSKPKFEAGVHRVQECSN